MMFDPNHKHGTRILLIGATGYIGGSVLSRLLEHPSAETFEITILVRSPEKAQLFKDNFDVDVVIGSNEDLGLVEELAENSHVVFSCADADNLPAVKAILKGLRTRHATVGDLSTLIHTSGTGVLTSDDRGEFASSIVYHDDDPKQIESLAPTQPHRNVDLAIVEADKHGYVKTYIILPSTIYGIASNPLVKAGIQNPISQQIPKLIRVALERDGEAGMVGKGLSIWPSVHIDDISQLYITLFDYIVNNPETTPHGREGFYFGENGEHEWYEISKEIASVLFKLGKTKTQTEPTTFTKEELVKYFGSEAAGYSYGTNARCRANRSRSIGWKPKYTKEDMLASIEPETRNILDTSEFSG
ncbi:NAD(P)-dependent Metabolic Enzyme [Abortiporus biennis]